MNRDYTGMLRFHSFVMQGKLTMPAIASESIAVTHNGQTMAVDETLLRITTLPEFNGKMANGRVPSSRPPTRLPRCRLLSRCRRRRLSRRRVRSRTRHRLRPPR
nr:type IV secretory system conjugative DNA transfer family protein [Aeromonas veronii]